MPPSTLPWAEAFVFFVPLAACAKSQRNTATHPDEAVCGFDCRSTVPLQSFLALSHSSSHARASALTSPPPDFLFISIHQTPPSHKFPPSHPKQKEQTLLVLPSVHTILNVATEFFEMFTKKQSRHPQKVFQVFQVFRVFHFAFRPQNRPVLVQIRTKPKNRHPPTSTI